MTITFPANRTVFAFLGAGSLCEGHFFDCFLIISAYQFVNNQDTMQNSVELRLNAVKHYYKVVKW